MRFTGKSTRTTTYNVTDYHPLDTRQLVPTFEDLTILKNWEAEVNGKTVNIAYNGMIVAVGNDDEAKNGVYYLFDKEKPEEKDIPTVTNPANWYKLAKFSDINNLTEQDIAEIVSTVKSELENDNSYVKNDADFAALKGSVSNNTSAIAALLDNDNDSVRNIAKDEISTQLSDTTSDLGKLVFSITNNTDAINALRDNALTTNSLASELSKFGVNTFVEDSKEIIALTNPGDSRKLGIKEIDISKLVQSPLGIQIILNGGSATYNENGYN